MERFDPGSAADPGDPGRPDLPPAPPPSSTRRRRSTIARRILSQSLLLAAVPVLVVGSLSIGGLFLLGRNADRHIEASRLQLTTEIAGQGRSEQALATVQATDAFVAERIDDVIDWTRAGPVASAAAAARPGFDGLTPDELAAMPPDTKVETGTNAVDYLRSQIVGQPLYGAVMFTNAAGLTVASTSEMTQFVHSQQSWWIEAWENGGSVGAVERAPATGELQFEVALRIDDRSTGRRLGVMLATVNASSLQALAEAQAARSNGVAVQLFSADGTLLVDTSGGAGGTFAIDNVTRAALDELAKGESASGFVVASDTVAGYAQSVGMVETTQVIYDVTSPRWIAVTRQPISTALAPLSDVDQIGDELDSTLWLQGGLVIAVVVLTLILVFIVSRRLATRIARPINELRDEAIRVADRELPHLVSSLEAGYDLDEIAPSAPIEIDADGEVADLAAAFSTLQQTATNLAAGQTIGRHRDVAAVLLNLGRRNQQLIGRQLRYIDQLERNESDPDTLKNLFLLDQMATRMRRNAESLLVLAGEDPPRRGTQPRPPEEILRAAISEVEDYARVAIAAAEPASIRPHVVSDLTHLLAELIENATNFSAPETMIHVSGERDPDGSYTISVIDRGIGMSPDRLAQANQRISDPTFSSDASSSFLGLYVVGRLAARHDIAVRLVESGSAGIAAVVTLPPDCLVDELPDPTHLGGYGHPITGSNPLVRRTTGPITSQVPALRPPSVLPPSVQPYFAPHRAQTGPGRLGEGDLGGPGPSPDADRPAAGADDAGSGYPQLPAWTPGQLSAGPSEPEEADENAPDLLARPRQRGDAQPGGNGFEGFPPPGALPPAQDPPPPAAPQTSNPIAVPPTVFDRPSEGVDEPLASPLAGLLPNRTSSEGGVPTTEERLGELASMRSASDQPERRDDDTDSAPLPASQPDGQPGRATFQVKRRVPGRALAEAGQAVNTTPVGPAERPQLDADGNLPETSMTRAAEVRDKLTRFAIGVGAAKAEKTDRNGEPDGRGSEAEGRQP